MGAATMPAMMGPSVWVRPAAPTLPASPACPLSHLWEVCVEGAPELKVPCSLPTDVNECETGVHRCGEGQVCHNLPGSYRCDCKAGFQRDAFGRGCIGR